jgi:hypothetical protein
MTDEEVQAIEAREQAAPTGPWASERGALSAAFGQHRYFVFGPGIAGSRFILEGFHGPDGAAAAEFVAAARQDVPDLVAEVKRLQREQRLVAARAWDAGFAASSEGWNAESPFSDGPTDEEVAERAERRASDLREVLS